MTVKSNGVLKIWQPFKDERKVTLPILLLFKVEKLTYWSGLHNLWKWELVFLTGVVKCDLFNKMFYQ